MGLCDGIAHANTLCASSSPDKTNCVLQPLEVLQRHIVRPITVTYNTHSCR